MQDFSHNITAYHHTRLSSVVDQLIQDFNSAYTQIVASESPYAAASNSLQEAVDRVPSRFASALETLGGYEVATEGVRDSELKEFADALYRALNGSLSFGSSAVDSALPVSCMVRGIERES